MVNEVSTILERRPEQIPPVCQGDIPQLYVSRAADVVGELSDLMAKGAATDAAEHLALVRDVEPEVTRGHSCEEERTV